MAKAFNLPLELHDETIKRMHAQLRARGDDPNAQSADQRKARERMAMLPKGNSAEAIFVAEDKWVPVVRLGGKVSINTATGLPCATSNVFYLPLAVYLPRYPSAFRTTPRITHPLPTLASRLCQTLPSTCVHQHAGKFDCSISDRVASEGEEEWDSMWIVPHAVFGYANTNRPNRTIANPQLF
jgi:hypothetical protein